MEHTPKNILIRAVKRPGTEEAEARLTLNGMSSLQVCGDTVALWQNGKLSLYDKGLCQVGEYVSAQEHTGFWLSAARDRVYCMDTDGRCLSASLKDAESAEKTGEELSFSSAFLQYYEPEIISLAAEGERLLIRGTDPKSLRRQYYVVDAQSGEILESLGQYPAGKACSGGAGEKGGWLRGAFGCICGWQLRQKPGIHFCRLPPACGGSGGLSEYPAGGGGERLFLLWAGWFASFLRLFFRESLF